MKSTSAPAFWPNANVLVTGATGLVGSWLVNRLLARGAQVTCFIPDNDPASPLWYSGDIERVRVRNGRLEIHSQIKSVIVEQEFDTIFHLGAQTIVGAGRRDPHGTFEANIRGTYNLLEACRLYGESVRHIVVASSDKAYGDCDTLPYTENTPLGGRNPYDASKACADILAQTYSRSYGLPIAITRCGNIFGPGDLNWNRLVPGTIRSLLNGQRPVIRSDGTLVRDYLYVDDAVTAYLQIAEWLSLADDRTNNAFNISANAPLTVLEMTQRIQTACGCEDLSPVVLSQACGEIKSQHLDSSCASRVLNWTPQHDISDALRLTVDWYRQYLSRFDPLPQSLTLTAPLLRPARASA